MINTFKEKLSPKSQRIIVVAGSIIVLLLFVGMFTGDKKERTRVTREETIRSVLTDRSTRSASIDALAAELEILDSEKRNLAREFEAFKRDYEREQERSKGGSEDEIKKLAAEIAAIRKENSDLALRLAERAERTEPGESASKGGARRERVEPGEQAQEVSEDEFSDPEAFFRDAPTPKISEEEGRGSRRDRRDGAETLRIASFSSSGSQSSDEEAQDTKKDEDTVVLTAGSIISGVIINGIDAPTSVGAHENPFPSVVRVQHEAILPNRHRMDIRECFLIISGYGDLSSERGYFRGESLSCVKDDGTILEGRLDSYVVGEDGKAGLRGRLVSKQGQLIARSLMAGFFSGASEVFDVRRVPQISLTGHSTSQFETTELGSTLARGAAAKGAGQALERIAQFYIEMAEGIFPVIEIDAGRQVEVIVTRGTRLSAQN